MITCIIVDDEQHAIDVLKNYIQRIPSLELLGSFLNPLEALKLIGQKQVDLLFLDIQMPEISGMDFIRMIRDKGKVILTTAYSEFVTEGFELEVADYLLKPIPFPRFLKAVQRVEDMLSASPGRISTQSAAPDASSAGPSNFAHQGPGHHSTTPSSQPGSPAPNASTPPSTAPASLPASADSETLPDDYFFVKTELKGKMLKINLRDIDYIESMKNYVAIHHNGVKTMALLNMKDLEDRLPARWFIRTHRSFIIAIDKINAIEGNTIQLRHIKEGILLGDTYRSAFLERMKKKMME